MRPKQNKTKWRHLRRVILARFAHPAHQAAGRIDPRDPIDSGASASRAVESAFALADGMHALDSSFDWRLIDRDVHQPGQVAGTEMVADSVPWHQEAVGWVIRRRLPEWIGFPRQRWAD